MIQARQEEIREEERRRQQEERLAGEGEEGSELLVAAGVQELHIGSSATATVRLLFLRKKCAEIIYNLSFIFRVQEHAL